MRPSLINQPYDLPSTLDSSLKGEVSGSVLQPDKNLLGNFRVSVWLICSVFIFSFFFFSSALAQDLANFGEHCNSTPDCVSGLSCIGNACVECTANKICPSKATCEDGVCVWPGGNKEGEFCANPDQCASKVCGYQGTCQSQAGEPGKGTTGTNQTQKPAGNIGTGTTGPLSNFPGEDLQFSDVTNIIIGLSCWLTRIAFTLALIFIILAGFRFMAAQGNQAKYGEAVKNFRTVLLGILVIYGVYVIIATVAHAVGVTNFSFIPLVC